MLVKNKNDVMIFVLCVCNLLFLWVRIICQVMENLIWRDLYNFFHMYYFWYGDFVLHPSSRPLATIWKAKNGHFLVGFKRNNTDFAKMLVLHEKGYKQYIRTKKGIKTTFPYKRVIHKVSNIGRNGPAAITFKSFQEKIKDFQR